MSNVDFLPSQYKQRRVHRRQVVWRNAVTAGLCATLVMAALVQSYLHRSLVRQLAAITPQYDEARQQTERLNQLQLELKAAQADAELFTYLRHPWPRTQILAELVRSLPAEVTFRQLQIGHPASATSRRGVVLATEKQQEEAGKKELPAVSDLKRLREEKDQAAIVVTLEGTTSNSDALHRYLSQLNGTGLFSRAELESLDEQTDHKGQMQFLATIRVRPGYGLPGGPTGPAATELAGKNK